MITEKDLQTFKTLLNEKIQANLIKTPANITTERLRHLGNCNETLSRVNETLRQLTENCDVILQSSTVPDPRPYDNTKMKVIRLIYKDVRGAGKQIYADVSKQKTDCVEFSLPRHQRIVEQCGGSGIMATEPWIQFEPEERDKMMDQTFIEIVDAWNEKYGEDIEASNRK